MSSRSVLLVPNLIRSGLRNPSWITSRTRRLLDHLAAAALNINAAEEDAYSGLSLRDACTSVVLENFTRFW